VGKCVWPCVVVWVVGRVLHGAASGASCNSACGHVNVMTCCCAARATETKRCIRSINDPVSCLLPIVVFPCRRPALPVPQRKDLPLPQGKVPFSCRSGPAADGLPMRQGIPYYLSQEQGKGSGRLPPAQGMGKGFRPHRGVRLLLPPPLLLASRYVTTKRAGKAKGTAGIYFTLQRASASSVAPVHHIDASCRSSRVPVARDCLQPRLRARSIGAYPFFSVGPVRPGRREAPQSLSLDV
jgi:hypothetical protein